MRETPSASEGRAGPGPPGRPLPSARGLDDVTAALLGRPLELGRRDVSRRAHVSLHSARRFWQALGFPLFNTDEALFTEADVDALLTVAALVRRGDLDEPTALQLTRAFAWTADRLASWQVQLVAEAVEAERDSAADLSADHCAAASAQATARHLLDLADDLEPLLVYAWRRHLADAVSRLLTDAEPGTADDGVYRLIGFADLVAFSALVRRSTERELAVVVQQFEQLSADVVTAHGGRIVKTVGDAILFSNRGAAPAAATAVDLVEAIAAADLLPDVRVGLAAGRVMPRLGDVFGTTVNRAARLTAIAHRGSVLVDAPRRTHWRTSRASTSPRCGPGPCAGWARSSHTCWPGHTPGPAAASGPASGERAGDAYTRRPGHPGGGGRTVSADTASPSLVRLEADEEGHVVELVLERPEALNAVSTAMAAAIVRATARIAADPAVRCVVLRSSQNRAFCVGADLKERNAMTDAQLARQRPGSRAAYRGVLDLPVPAIAAVEGYALGGGYELALSCDLIVAGEDATVGLPEVSVGLIPGGGGTQLLTRRVGWSRAASLVFTARRLTAPEALTLGCVDEVVPTGTARERALELAGVVALNSPVGVRAAKRAMRLGADVDLAAGLEVEDACWRTTAFSADRTEGIAAFVERRGPRWPGR